MALRPMPSCAIVQFGPDPSKGSLAAGYHLPRGTQVFKAPAKEQLDSLYFRTCADVTLWPLEVHDASLIEGIAAQSVTGIVNAEAALRLVLKCNNGKPWTEFRSRPCAFTWRGLRAIDHNSMICWPPI